MLAKGRVRVMIETPSHPTYRRPESSTLPSLHTLAEITTIAVLRRLEDAATM
jgi:hypothetical protein